MIPIRRAPPQLAARPSRSFVSQREGRRGDSPLGFRFIYYHCRALARTASGRTSGRTSAARVWPPLRHTRGARFRVRLEKCNSQLDENMINTRHSLSCGRVFRVRLRAHLPAPSFGSFLVPFLLCAPARFPFCRVMMARVLFALPRMVANGRRGHPLLSRGSPDFQATLKSAGRRGRGSLCARTRARLLARRAVRGNLLLSSEAQKGSRAPSG